MPDQSHRFRPFAFSALILVLVSIVCTRLPLFNYLGFEFSIVVSLIGSLVAGLYTIARWRHFACEEISDLRKYIGSTAGILTALSSLPFFIMCGNALVVRNCSIGEGALLYLLIVLPAMFLSEAIALLIVVSTKRFSKTLFVGSYCMILLHIPLTALFSPQVFVFNPIVGYFPGFTYDESLNIISRLLMYRLLTVAGAIVVFAVAAWLWNRKYSQESHRSFYTIAPEILLLALLVPLLIVFFMLSDRVGLSSSEDFIMQKLGGSYRTAHCDLVYPPGSIDRERIEQIGILHEYYYDRLCRFLQVTPDVRVTSFLYASPEQKGKLTGAAATDFARPWQHQLHINLADIDGGLEHEMAHVLAADFGWTPLKVGRTIGLVEGLAVAAGNVWYEDSLQHCAAMILGSDPRIDPETLFHSFGFATSYAGVSYALAGSFCRYIIDVYGIEKFKVLYASGDYCAIYGKDLPALMIEWRQSLQHRQLTPADSVRAAYFFKRKSIFGKECARVIGAINAETRAYLKDQNDEQALASAEHSLQLSNSPEAVMQKITALSHLHQYKEVVAYGMLQLSDTAASSAVLPIHLALGDAYWSMDSLQQAKKQYEYLASVQLNLWYQRATTLRLLAMESPESRELKIYFTYAMEDSSRIARLARLSSPIARLLLAHELFLKGHHAEARIVLERGRTTAVNSLTFFRLRELARVLFEEMEYEKAQKCFHQAFFLAPTTGFKIETQEWEERCIFWEK